MLGLCEVLNLFIRQHIETDVSWQMLALDRGYWQSLVMAWCFWKHPKLHNYHYDDTYLQARRSLPTHHTSTILADSNDPAALVLEHF